MSSECSDIGDISDVTPFTIFKDNPSNLEFDKNSFTCGSINLNSILHANRLDQVESILRDNNFSVFCINESKLDDSKDPACYKIDNYIALAKHRTIHGGGIVVYVRDDIACRRLSDLENNTQTLEHVAVEVFVQNKRILINSFYRPPNCERTMFINDLTLTLERIHLNRPWLSICLGDCNFGAQFCHFNSLNPTSFDFQCGQIFEDYHYTQIIDQCTRYSKDSVSLLDLIYVNRFDMISKAVLFPQIADHMGIACEANISCTRPRPRVIVKNQFSDMTSENWSNLKSYLLEFKSSESWTSDYHCEALTNHIISGIEKFVPKTTFKQKHVDIPWSSKVVRRALLKKNKSYKLYRNVANQFKLLRPDDPNYVSFQTRVCLIHDKFRQSSKQYKYESRRAKNQYFQNLKNILSNSKIPEKKKFSLLKKLSKTSKDNSIPPLLENGELVNDPLEQAEIFNRYFNGKSNVRNPNDEPPILESFVTKDVFENLDTSHFELGPIIKSLKSSNYSPCGIPSRFLIDVHTTIGSTLTKMISDLLNKVFHTGTYPQIWKLAHVTPIFKSKEKSNKTNYRPISILPTLSKICESVLHKRLLDHLLTNNIITKYQAAYIPSDSTAQQLISMIHQIKLAMTSNNIAQGVFLDVSAAFDAVWHRGLLAKLEQLNIKGEALTLFSSYLSERRTVTVIDGVKSTELPVNAGVPQGSRLGPLLFLVYTNDLVVNLESKPFIFADDTTLIATAESTFETTNMLSRDLAKISTWAHTWKITFNPQKSKTLIFSKALLPSHPVIMDLTIIERVHIHKHLGIFLTSNLSWDRQIAHITKKVNLKLSIIWGVKELSRQCLDILCKMHIRSTIDYCITVFGPCLNQSQMAKLDRLLYRAGKLVTGALKFTSSNELFAELGWETTPQRIKLLCLSQFHKIIHKNTTPLIHECLPPPITSRYPTKRTFQHYNNNKTFFEQSFFPVTIKLWDGLEMGLRGLEHTEFKIKLKEIFKPPKFKHYNVGFKFPNSLHTQLRLKRSNLNSHLYSIGLCITPACKCGSGQLETVKHFLLECKLYEQARGLMFEKLECLLERSVSKYTKSNLLEILLHGEKPHLYDKFQHNKFIFYSVQRFICMTKRLYTMSDANKPCNIAIPNNHGDNTHNII